MLHVPRFHRREKSQEVSLKRAVGSRHSRILDVTDSREMLLQEMHLSLSPSSLSFFFFPDCARGSITWMNRSFSSVDILGLLVASGGSERRSILSSRVSR